MEREINTRVKRSASQEELVGEELNKRIRELRAALKGWVPEGGMESMRLWEMFTEFKILPYSGGWLDQPGWFRRDVEMFMMKAELARHLEKLPKPKPGMAKMGQLTGAGNGG
jgi:hypothetical protein